MEAYKDYSNRKRNRYCDVCGLAGRFDVGERRCPRCGTRWPRRTKEYDELAKRKVAESGCA